MRLAIVLCVLGVLVAAQGIGDVYIPMDQQIDVGQGPAIYAMYCDPCYVSFEQGGEPEGYTQLNLTFDPGSWYYVYVDLIKAGIGPIDISGSASAMDVFCRYFQDPDTNTNPYGDAPIFMNLYTYDDLGTYLGKREFGIFYATQPDWNDPPYPDWTEKYIPLNDMSKYAYNDVADFDPTRVTHIRFWGTDWAGTGDDFVNLKRLLIVPEPGLAVALGMGLAAVLPFMRRRK
jgi:hypothetical protein